MSSGGKFNTLAQNGTTALKAEKKFPISVISGKGSANISSEALKRKAQRKLIGLLVARAMLKIAYRRDQPHMIRGLFNAIHCQEEIVLSGGRQYGLYCKTRICPICSSIRKAVLINKYLPAISKWKDPVFLTLTVKAVKKHRLRDLMRKMTMVFRNIIGRYRKRQARGNGTKLIGVRSLECCFNSLKNTYNPHFHIVLASREMGDTLRSEWLRAWESHWTNPKGQFTRSVGELQRDLMETIKYGAKHFSESTFQHIGILSLEFHVDKLSRPLL